MGTSFTDYRGYGFWANDGLLSVWLAALADAVPGDAPLWLREAGHYWREHAGVGFTGCVNADLDTLVTSGDQAQAVLGVTEAAARRLAGLAGITGYLPAAWLNDRHVSGEVNWTSSNVRLDYVQQIKDAFVALLRGELLTTPATSPVLPRMGQSTG